MGATMCAYLSMKDFDCTNTPVVCLVSGTSVGGTILSMGSRFLSASLVPLTSTSKPKKVHVGYPIWVLFAPNVHFCFTHKSK